LPEQAAKDRAVLLSSLSLLAFSALSTIALVGWFHNNPSPWNWKSVLTIGCTILAFTTSRLVWSAPSRGHAIMGAVILLVSLARVGPPAEWTAMTLVLFALTLALAAPLGHAALLLGNDAQRR
jgi:hypothetical protein